eukprot:TRINITY_DN102905_c0_g1_i1.p1 TRINITY_DN102905_c0_g1~~TRINITY_DN102905_c0_g1_i1.p1  ORF type:complete len:522 (+),score=84.22 TRINITY_DN102905_c0_g1_i1:194-1567(+)
MQQSESRAARLADVRRIAMEALIGSDTQNDVAEEVEVEDDEDDEAGNMSMDVDNHNKGKKLQRLRRLHRTLFFARQLQVPDWMLAPPDDLAASWMVLARPEGDRYLLLSDGGRVEVRRKNGYVQERYTDSRMPRGLTILDVVCIERVSEPTQPSVAVVDDIDAGSAATAPQVGEEGEEDEECDDGAEGHREDIDMDSNAGGGYGKASGKARKSKGKGRGKGRRSRPSGDRTYAVCDVLVWGDIDMAGAEAECRLFFLQSRMEEMRETHPRRARPLKLVRALPATPESLQELYTADVGYPKDSLLFLHREGHYQLDQPITPLALMWRDRHLSRFVVDTPDAKGESLPERQAVVLEVRGGGRLRTADRMIVAQCPEEAVAAAQGLTGKGNKAKGLLRCDVQSVDVANRCLVGVVPKTHIPARSRVWADSWGRIVFQHLHREGKASVLSFDALIRAASGV